MLVLGTLLCFASTIPARQQKAAAQQPKDRMFSGLVTAIGQTSITVTQWVLGKETAVRTFAITAGTRIEGKPRVKNRVTVRYSRDEDGTDRAVHIIVRPPANRK